MSTYPLYNWNLEPSISFAYYAGVSGGVTGNPALAVDAYENTFFAAVVQGQNPTASPTIPSTYWTYNNVVVGSADINGNLLWYKFFPELVVAANQLQVSLVVGTNNDLYVAFVTPAAVNKCFNMATIPRWCPPLYPDLNVEGTDDIVLARINYTNTKQTVAWVQQNARLNSVYNETVPQLAIDTNNQLLYITYQTNGDVLCYSPIGDPTVVLSCFNTDGAQLWLECQGNINSAGSNTNPVVAADLSGGVYVAYETTQTVQGGAMVTGQQIEMVKFQTTLTPDGKLASYNRQWILSQNGNIQTQAPGVSSAPSVTSDGVNVFIAFLTTGSVAGNYSTGSAHDLVVAKVTTNGYTPWVQQGEQFNRAPYTYVDAGFPYITADRYLSANDIPNVVISLQTFDEIYPNGDSNIFVFKLDSATGNNTFDNAGYNNLPLAFSQASSSTTLLPTAAVGTYSQVAVSASRNALFFLLGSLVPLSVNTITSCEADLILLKYRLVCYYPTTSPFQFMSNTKKICGCGANCCCNNTKIPGKPIITSVVPGANSALIYYNLPNDGGSPLINFMYSIDPSGVVFQPFLPPQTNNPLNITGLTVGTDYSIQIEATNSLGTGPPSDPIQVIVGTPAPPTNLDVEPGNNSAVITFTPGSNNGSAITNYSYSLDGGATFTPFSPSQTSSPVTISGLTNGTLYSIQLEATNARGTGPPTATYNLIAGAPTAPTNLVATSGNTTVSIAFTASDGNGHAVTNYAYSLNGGMTFIPFSPSQTSSPVTISGLTNGTVYNIKLEGINTYGAGAASAQVTITPGIPAPPTSLSGTPGDTTATISFTPGANNGSAITNYQYSVDGGSTFTAFSPTQSTSPVTISGLTDGVSYSIKLKAVNANGISTASSTVTVTPRIPAQILLQAYSYSGFGSWLDQSGNGNNATLVTGSSSKNTAENGIVLDGSSYWSFPDIAANQHWTVSVWYKNTAPAETNGGIVTQSFSNYGGGMVNLYIQNNGSNNFVGGFLTYTNIHNGTQFLINDGGWNYYQITWDNTNLNTYINGVLQSSVVSGQTSLNLGQIYYIGRGYQNTNYFVTGEIGEVRIYDFALNQTQITRDYNNTVATYNIPGAPTGLTATAGAQFAYLTWTPPVDDGGLAITSYTITSSPGNVTLTAASSPASYSEGALMANVTYTFTIVATNLSGNSHPSDPSNPVTPYPICLARGTLIMLTDRTQKPIEEITYNDSLLVWDFDNGCLAKAKPLWIKKAEVTDRYNLLEFENGAQLKTINQHRIFNNEAGKFTYPMTDETPVGTTTYHIIDTYTRLISKTVVEEQVEYYNVITEKHINLFANGILTSCRYNNIYPIADMKFIKSPRPAIEKEEYQSVPNKYYEGLRLYEQTIPPVETIKYIERLEALAIHSQPI